MESLIGRTKEKKQLLDALKSKKPEFVAIYGRRRVGKTYLIRQSFGQPFTFYLTGMANSNLKNQLLNFSQTLKNISKREFDLPLTWFEAFEQLKAHIELSKEEKKIIFIDELPWLDTPKSNFISILEHFWNHWASARKDILLVVCGSAASWMINKLINNRGGLHNRLTKRIKLNPFNLRETEDFLRYKGIILERYQIVQLYMAFGGIPYYLDEIVKGESAAQNIERICFSESGALRNEFNVLFKSIFNNYSKHEQIVKVLATKNAGLLRTEIIDQLKLKDGGSISKTLSELEESGFIRKYKSFNKKVNQNVYQLTDFYSLFYLKYILNSKIDPDNWINFMSDANSTGYAYELVWLQHINQIKQNLGIIGVLSNTATWHGATDLGKAQIDLLLDRKDHIINICEAKFSISEFVISKEYAMNLRKKIAIFTEATKTKKTVCLTILTTFGLKENENSLGLIQNTLTLENLFNADL
jgi:AAA+ ATPase superfamily predicted ATPase